MAFVALGQVHRRVRAAGRRSGDLYERVPALLVLSGQQARVDPAAAGEGEVGRGHDRPVLQGPDQEDEARCKAATCPSPRWARCFNPCSTITRPMRSTSTVADARRSQAQAAGSPGRGELLARSLRRAGEVGGGLLRSRVRATAPVQPRSTIDGGRGCASIPEGQDSPFAGSGVFGETLDLDRHSGSRQADASRDVRIRLRGRHQRRTDRAPEQRRFHASFPGFSTGDEGARFVEDRIDGRPQLPRAKRC